MKGHPASMGEVVDLFCADVRSKYPPGQAENSCREISSAASRILAPALGFKRKSQGRRMTKIEKQSALAFLKTRSIQNLPRMLGLISSFFEEKNIPKSVRNTYGARLRQLHDFAFIQYWYPGNRASDRFKNECAPPLPRCYGRTADDILMPFRDTSFTYGLTDEEIGPSLQAEFDKLYDFCCASYYPGRVIAPCSPHTADQYILQSKLFMGWWGHHHQPNLIQEELTLRCLVPVITVDDLDGLTPKEQRQRWREARHYVSAWINAYFKFMTEKLGSYSPRTREQRLIVISKIGHFLYTDEVESQSEYAQIPIIGVINDIKREWHDKAEEWNSNRQFAADQTKKLPEVEPGGTALAAIQDGLMLMLCLRCKPRNSAGVLHDPHPQARFYAAFIIWFELSFEPPRRQQEICSRRLALTCLVQRPADVPADGLYHPLPPIEVRDLREDGKLYDNYLFKTYTLKGVHYPEGIWVRQINRYKTQGSYGQQDIILRNRLMMDGRWLYEYLENYLYGEWYTGSFTNSTTYDWWDPQLKGQRGRWLTPGVMAFEPVRHEVSDPKAGDWPWMPCFPVPDTGNAYDRSGLSSMVGRTAHQWTGKRTTPHLMRRIWATWAFQVGLDDKAIHSLAYAMGTSYETLKKWYEDATPEDKRRSIEEKVDEFFIDYLNQVCEKDSWNGGEVKSVELRKVLQILPQLTKEERKTVQQVLDAS